MSAVRRGMLAWGGTGRAVLPRRALGVGDGR